MTVFQKFGLFANWMFFMLDMPLSQATYFKRHPLYGKGYMYDVAGYIITPVSTSFKCASNCAAQPACLAFQMGPANSSGLMECQQFQNFQPTNDSFTHSGPGYFFYVQHFEAGTEPYLMGTAAARAAVTCSNLPALSPSGVYWIDPDGGSRDNAFEAYCDMDTAGGGWTLVYSYTFTAYNTFMALANGVTPIPNWPLVSSNGLEPISTNPPLNENQGGAVNFSLWYLLGSDFLIKSNLNHWVMCEPIVGSLVTMTSGSIKCTQVKSVTGEASCSSMLSDPTELWLIPNGPGIKFVHTKSPFGLMYYWDGSTTQNWPTHDPCGIDTTSFVKGLSDPRGNIYIK